MFLVSCEVKKIGEPTAIASATSVPVSPSPTATASPTPKGSATPRPTPDCEKDSDCDDDSWEDTGETKWIDADQCNKKEQKEQEYKDYYCNTDGECDYSVTDTRWEDTGNTECKPDGIGCDPDASPSPSSTAEPTGSSSPTPSPTPKGFCKDCACVERNCENVYGSDYDKCGKKGLGLKCCSKGKCCKKFFSTVCCRENEKCSSSLGFALCTAEFCPASAPKKCSGPKADYCCPASSHCVTIGGFAECGDAGDECPTGKTMCPPGEDKAEGGVFCCNDETETCITDPKFDYPFCQPKEDKCQEGYSLCTGLGEASWRKTCCKNGIETCRWDPDGYPRCECLENGETGGSCESSTDCEGCQFCKDGTCTYEG